MDEEQFEPAGSVEGDWDQGWDGHEQAQLRRFAQMSLYDKIGWLEEAHRLVRHLQGNRAPDATPEGTLQPGDECSPLKKGA
ncbi:MAG: hypothetical protein M3Y56_12280 [Armatimonadota bacterium]|nr:hypothetical protein [Armatimonadota bacterium]